MLPLVLAVSACSSVSTGQPKAENLPTLLGYDPGSNKNQPALPADVDWWKSFNSPQLNELVNTGLQQNFSLKAAWANLAQSRALWREAGSSQYPDLALTADKTRQWNDDVTTDSWNAGLTAEYELDFWGRVSALDDQARMNMLSSEAALRTQANTVAAEITLNWFGYRMQQENLRLLSEQQQRIGEALKATRGRFQRGMSDISDVWQQEQLLESLHTDVIAARAARDAYQQQLALWTGRHEFLSLQQSPPADSAVAALPDIKQAVESLPLNVVQGRPDVESAWYSVQSATAGLAAAEAERYPRFTLSASYRGSDNDLSNVLDNWLANFVAGLALPLIDGGQRRAVVANRQAVLDAALANYQQAVLAAAQDVQLALISERENTGTLSSLERQLELAKKTELFQDNRYRKGVGDFLSLITAQRDVLDLEQRVLTARWNQVQSRITLFRAVSHGGFIKPADKENISAEKNQAAEHSQRQKSAAEKQLPQSAPAEQPQSTEQQPETPAVPVRKFNQLNSASLHDNDYNDNNKDVSA